MRRRIAEAAVVLVVGTMGSLTACGDDNADPAPPSSSAGKAGSGGKGNQGGSSAGDRHGPQRWYRRERRLVESRSGVRAIPGGSPGNGGATTGDGGTATGNGGEGATPASDAGAGGGDVGPPDLIVKTGGPWPDSFTGSCSSSSKAIPCPQLDDPLFGQDGNYRINVPTYASTVNTMTDSVTGLMWQLKPEVTSKTQVNAVAYCDALSLAGHDDWRLPTRLEYVTMLDEGLPEWLRRAARVPADSDRNAVDRLGHGQSRWQLLHRPRRAGQCQRRRADTPYTARCVRGPALSGTLSVGVDTVLDTMTNLEWQRTASRTRTATGKKRWPTVKR